MTKILIAKETVELALKALKNFKGSLPAFWEEFDEKALTTLRQALEQSTEQEPVAMRYDFDGYGYKYIDSGSGSDWQTRIKDAEPVFAQPQKTAPTEQEPVACLHQRYSIDVHDQVGYCLDCKAEGRMKFVVGHTSPPQPQEAALRWHRTVSGSR